MLHRSKASVTLTAIVACVGVLLLYLQKQYNITSSWTAEPQLQSADIDRMQLQTLVGVYTPVDPATYDEVYPQNPDPRIKEIADLFIEWFKLLIDMRYMPASSIAFPPHKNLAIDTTKAAKWGFTKDVVDLWQMIPYRIEYRGPRWNFGSDNGELILGGEFLDDLREPGVDWYQATIDPFYLIDNLNPDLLPEKRPKDADSRDWDHEEGPYMKPWYAALTNCGNHGSIMVLDSKTYDMWLIDQLGGTSDPALQGIRFEESHRSSNRGDLSQFPSRPAKFLLRDIIESLKTLKWVPGGLYGEHYEFYKDMKELYIHCGWPDKFNPLLFDRLRRDGGKKYDYWGTREEDPMEKEWKPLKDLYTRLVYFREEAQQQIHYIDAVYRLENGYMRYEYERPQIEGRKIAAEDFLNSRKWERDQLHLRDELAFLETDLEALRTRGESYAGIGWAGVSDEEIKSLYKEALENDRIDELKTLLQDTDPESRLHRQLETEKAAARATDQSTWNSLAASNAEWENDDWADRWSVLGSGTMLHDVKRVLDEELSVEELRRLMVYCLEEREDPSWQGQRMWRNDNGKVTMFERGKEL